MKLRSAGERFSLTSDWCQNDVRMMWEWCEMMRGWCQQVIFFGNSDVRLTSDYWQQLPGELELELDRTTQLDTKLHWESENYECILHQKLIYLTAIRLNSIKRNVLNFLWPWRNVLFQIPSESIKIKVISMEIIGFLNLIKILARCI